MCVCVCEREREREKRTKSKMKQNYVGASVDSLTSMSLEPGSELQHKQHLCFYSVLNKARASIVYGLK